MRCFRALLVALSASLPTAVRADPGPAPAGEPCVHVTYHFEDDGVLSIVDTLDAVPAHLRGRARRVERPCAGEREATSSTVTVDARADVTRRMAEAGDDPRRLAWLHAELLRLDPEAFESLVWLARWHTDRQELQSALSYWERAAKLRPEDREVRRGLAAARRHAGVQDRFRTRRTGRFVVSFEGSERWDLAGAAIEILEEAHDALRERFGLSPPDPVPVVLYTGEQFARATPGPDWRSGVYDGTIRIREAEARARLGRLRDILHHEYWHALCHRALDTDVPSWFDEGVAELIEPEPDARAPRLVTEAAAKGALLPLGALQHTFQRLPEDVVSLAYAQARSVANFLVERRGEREFRRFLQAVREGGSFAQALQAHYGLDEAGVEKRWRDGLAR